MTRDEYELVAFALRWLPYGGGDEHILPQFGIMPHIFYRRLQTILRTNYSAVVDASSKRILLERCALKLSEQDLRQVS
ncbi:hypothetical protein EEB14_18425 [Rhodococcus sp. WS4]|nr:hypothetical protein EEB14_18425 [Rhodococcus sp. WS4]